MPISSQPSPQEDPSEFNIAPARRRNGSREEMYTPQRITKSREHGQMLSTLTCTKIQLAQDTVRNCVPTTTQRIPPWAIQKKKLGYT